MSKAVWFALAAASMLAACTSTEGASADTAAPSGSTRSGASGATLQAVRSRGTVRCGISKAAGFATPNDAGQWQGFDVDFCHAIAVAVFGDPAKVEFVEAFTGFSLPLDLIVNNDSLWVTDLNPLRFVKLDFKGNHLYTWLVPKDLPDGYLEVHTFSVDSAGNLYGGDNQYGRTQKFVPKPGADPAQLIGQPWVAR